MIFKCFALVGKTLDGKEPIEYCIVGKSYDDLYIGPTIEECKKQVLLDYPKADFKENCGWAFIGEEEKLLDPEIQRLVEESNAVPKTSEIPSDPLPKGKL